MTEQTHAQADLIPYSEEYAQTVRSWINTEETYLNVCHGKNFPPPDDIVESWQRPDVASYLLFGENSAIAYGELWIRDVERSVEIAHLIVDPFKQDKGYGTKMLNLLYNRAAARPLINKVILHLRGCDEVILGCYLKAGFELVGKTAIGDGLRMIRVVN